jgi:hypothetical protein
MRLAFGEVPNIAFVQDLNLVAAELIHSAHTYLALVDVAPLGDAVPVQFSD